jgi:hypothetical protein
MSMEKHVLLICPRVHPVVPPTLFIQKPIGMTSISNLLKMNHSSITVIPPGPPTFQVSGFAICPIELWTLS